MFGWLTCDVHFDKDPHPPCRASIDLLSKLDGIDTVDQPNLTDQVANFSALEVSDEVEHEAIVDDRALCDKVLESVLTAHLDARLDKNRRIRGGDVLPGKDDLDVRSAAASPRRMTINAVARHREGAAESERIERFDRERHWLSIPRAGSIEHRQVRQTSPAWRPLGAPSRR